MAVPDTVLFDFFGTLVEYTRSWTGLGYPATHALVQAAGAELGYDEFLAAWEAQLDEFETRAASDHVERSIVEAAAAFGARIELDLDPTQCQAMATTFGQEWSAHIRPIPGATEMIRRLGSTFRIGIVSNTGEASLVPAFLEQMQLTDTMTAVVLSVDHGYRKPHPSIYEHALRSLDAEPTTTVFVGDSYDADYLGPRNAGMAAFLIDPDATHPIPAEHRLTTVLDIEHHLSEPRLSASVRATRNAS